MVPSNKLENKADIFCESRKGSPRNRDGVNAKKSSQGSSSRQFCNERDRDQRLAICNGHTQQFRVMSIVGDDRGLRRGCTGSLSSSGQRNSIPKIGCLDDDMIDSGRIMYLARLVLDKLEHSGIGSSTSGKIPSCPFDFETPLPAGDHGPSPRT